MARQRQLKERIDQLENDFMLESAKTRQLQRHLDELSEANDSLIRENIQLKSIANDARRSIIQYAGTSRFGSLFLWKIKIGNFQRLEILRLEIANISSFLAYFKFIFKYLSDLADWFFLLCENIL